MSRKRSSYRPKPVYAHQLLRCVEAMAPLTRAELDDLEARQLGALDAVTRGLGTLGEAQALTEMVNVLGELVADCRRSGRRYVPEGLDMAACKDAIRRLAERYRVHRRLALTGPELVLMREASQCCMDTLAVVPRQEFEAVVRYLVARAASGHAEVLKTRPENPRPEQPQPLDAVAA